MSGQQLPIETELEIIQRKSFSYFAHETNPRNGLVIDKTAADWPASIAATGLALAASPVVVERGFMMSGTLGNNSPELSALFSTYVRWRTDWRGRKRRMRRAWVSPMIETTGAARIAAHSVLFAT